MKCKNCKHELLKHKNPKTGEITWLHFNAHYFKGRLNSDWCSKCEIENNKIGAVCRSPEPK